MTQRNQDHPEPQSGNGQQNAKAQPRRQTQQNADSDPRQQSLRSQPQSGTNGTQGAGAQQGKDSDA